MDRFFIFLCLAVPLVSGCLRSGVREKVIGAFGNNSCLHVNIVPRREWGARAPISTSPIHVPVSMFFIHHTATSPCVDVDDCSARVRSIQNYHMKRKRWDDIGYSFLVGEDGNVYEGRGWSRVGAHTRGYNSRSFAAAMIGNYTHRIPNVKAMLALHNLIACGVTLGKITNNYTLHGHCDASNFDSPGEALYALIRKWPHYSQTVL